jgi:hypothetical protein
MAVNFLVEGAAVDFVSQALRDEAEISAGAYRFCASGPNNQF